MINIYIYIYYYLSSSFLFAILLIVIHSTIEVKGGQSLSLRVRKPAGEEYYAVLLGAHCAMCAMCTVYFSY